MVNGVDKTERVFIAVYMIFFALLLLLFELNQIKSYENIDMLFKRNFGFLSHTVGNALFFIFIAFLTFGLVDPQILTFVTGGLLATFGITKLCIYLQYPELLVNTT